MFPLIPENSMTYNLENNVFNTSAGYTLQVIIFKSSPVLYAVGGHYSLLLRHEGMCLVVDMYRVCNFLLAVETTRYF